MTSSMQRIFSTIALLIGLSTTCFAQAPYEMLWEISHPAQARPSYLFGTMHISENRVFDLPDSVILAIQNTDGMAFELDFDSTSYYTFAYLMRDGEYSLDDLDKLAGRLNPPSYENAVDRWMERLSDTESKEDTKSDNSVLFLDAFLYRIGRDLGKARTGLEKVEDQFRLLYGGEGNSSVLTNAKSSIRSGDLTKAYLAGNMRQIETWLEEGKMFDPYARKLLLDDRNLVMARGADSLIRIRPTFIAVGAAHLPGKAGVISLLRQRGYQVRPVHASQKTGLARAAKASPYHPQWQEFRNEAAGYALKVPSRPYRASFTDLPVPMYMGMDFPGGWVYYYFAFPLKMLGAADRSDLDELRTRMVTAMIEEIDAEGVAHPVKFGSFVGEEAIVKMKDQSLRIRGVSDDKMIFVMFAGIDDEIVRNPMLDTMFNSLVSFPAKQLTQRQWAVRTDSTGGFSMTMPVETTRLSQQNDDSEANKLYYQVLYEADDEQTSEEFVALYAFLEAQVIEENDALPGLLDSIIANTHPLGTRTSHKDLLVDGYRAIDIEIDIDGAKTAYYRAVQRADRMYFIGGTATEEPASKQRIRSAIDSFRLLPLRHAALRHTLTQPDFALQFPSPAQSYSEEETETEYWMPLGGDSTHTWNATDPQSGILYFVTQVEFPAWTALDSLHEIFATFSEPVAGRTDLYNRPIQVPGAVAAWERRTTSMDKRSSIYIRLVMHGQNLYYMFSGVEDEDEGPARAFADGLRLQPAPAFDWTSSKLNMLFAMLDSTDEEVAYRAMRGIAHHRVDGGSRQQIFDYLRRSVSKPDVLDRAYPLIDELAYTPTEGDAAAYTELVKAYAANPEVQAYLIGAMFYQDTLGLTAQGIRLLKEVQPTPPDPYSIEDMVVRIEYVLQQSKDPIAMYDSLAFMLDVPAYQPEFLYLTETMGAIGELEARHTGLYRQRFQDLAEEWLVNRRYDYESESLAYAYDYLLSALYLADPDAKTYALIERIMDMGDPRVEEYAVLMLLDADHPVSKARLLHLVEQPAYSEGLLNWLWVHDQQKRLPKKYWKTDRLAKTILLNRIVYGGVQPTQVEFLQKVPLVWEEADHYLYVYRIGWEDREDWEIAFSGPFPQDGKLRNFNFDLTGTESKTWTPQRQEELIDEWIETNTYDGSEDWDE
jgi:uncharacterized protein YbaP (TraB family)